jgi:tetratricopeptide (TPR) repeat protein
MTTGSELRSVIIGLAGLAATEERMLLVATPADEPGSAQCWAALPLIAHNTEFKQQQISRLRAVRLGQVPPDFAETDHGSAEVYERYAAIPAGDVLSGSGQAAADLADALGGVTDEDLLDPARHPWLRGRQLWLQVIVRGFWHPMGHLGEYYLAHRQPERAVALAAQAVATAAYLRAPGQARGMACYNLACAQARRGLPDQAARTLNEAISLNPDLRANASRDPDLVILRS